MPENETKKSSLGITEQYKQTILEELIKAIPDTRTIQPEFISRLELYFSSIFEIYFDLYGKNVRFRDFLIDLFGIIYKSWCERDVELKILDQTRINNPTWFQDNLMIGGVCYIDLFAGNINNIKEKIWYFKELGLTYLHLMPFFLSPHGDNDGGYAVSSYRSLNQNIGTIEDLRMLSKELKTQGISLVADFVFNHTSNEHEWAIKAKNGIDTYEDFYFIFPGRKIPDAYEKTLREIFPTERPGSFTFDQEMRRWILTTFHSYQWDLKYANPNVFNSMVAEMLFLANCGIDILRLDAIAFIWKELGTDCENLPQAHSIIKAFNAICKIAAPALLFKSEAIVHPNEVKKYIHPEECPLSYNPLLMAVLWTCLASQEVRLLNLSMQRNFEINPECAWVNYIRCHDDIGWTFDDSDAQELHIHGFYHRKWLNEFYSGRFTGSYASGLLFQENPKTGDARISGTAASLAGLEKALISNDDNLISLAISRIILLHGIIISIGGIPLIYLGDEIGTLNDYSFLNDPGKAKDSRWVHRSKTDWEKYKLRNSPYSVEGRIFNGLKKLIDIRKTHKVFSGNKMQIINTANDSIFGFMREYQNERCFVLSNFSEASQNLVASNVRKYSSRDEFVNLITKAPFSSDKDYLMRPYEQIIII